MRSVIHQSVELPAPPERLFAMYLDLSEHAAFTGHPVMIGALPGAEFHAFGGRLSGQVLAVIPARLIVQSWRSVKFNAGDPDSTLVLSFSTSATDSKHGRIDLVHVDVPDHDYQGVVEGWQKHYWTPWRAYLEQQA